jgi:hypothetical protein
MGGDGAMRKNADGEELSDFANPQSETPAPIF